MADGQLKIEVVVDGVDIDKVKKKIKELKVEATKQAKSDGLENVKKGLEETGQKAEKAKAKVKEFKDEAGKKTNTNGLDNVIHDLTSTGTEAEKAKTKVKGFKDEVNKSVKSQGLENVKKDLSSVGNEAEKGKKGVKEFVSSFGAVRVASQALKTVKTALFDVNSGLDNTSKKTEETSDKLGKGTNRVKDFFLAFGAVRIAEKAIGTLTSALDGAIKRFDTLNSYPRVLKLMGYDTKQVAKSTKQLSDGIDGLPTSLDEVVSTSKQLTTITKDLRYSTKLTLALNNAFLASGSSAEDASRGLVQFQQMLSSGKVDMQSWKTLQETMPIALTKTAEAFGFTGKSAKTEFYNALRDGKITFNDFGQKLIELNKGAGGFAELAKESTRGLGTSLKNLSNATVKGLGNMIQAFDDFTKQVTGKNIDQHIDSMKHAINGAFTLMNNAIKSAGAPIAFIVNGFKKLLEICPPLKVALDAIVVAFATMLGWAVLQAILQGIATGFVAVTTALIAMKTAVLALMGPVGWTAVAITALGSAFFALTEYLKSDDLKQAEEDIKNLKTATDDLTKSVTENNEQHKDNLKGIKESGKANEQLAQEVINLANSENLSGAQKILLKKKIESLNQSIEGLNLKYDKNTGKLSMNKDAIMARIKAGEGENKLVAIEKELSSAYADQRAVVEQLKAVEEEKRKVQEMSGLTDWEKRQKVKQLDEQYKQLQATHKETESTINSLSLAQKQAAVEVANAVENGASRQIVSYESLSANQQKVVDELRTKYDELHTSATGAFERIKQDAVVSAGEMANIMSENTNTVKTFGDNIKTLTERGLDQGLIEQLRQAGPKSAEQVRALASASDTELQTLNTKYKEGGEAAVEALKNSLNIPSDTFTEPIKNMITQSKTTLSTAVSEAGFEEIGKGMTEKIATSIETNGEAPVTAINKVATNITDGFGNTMGIQSPSTVMAEKGKFVVEGIVQGIEQSQNSVDTIMKSVADTITQKMDQLINDMKTKANELPKVFDAMRGAMTSSGEYAMAGLAVGLANGAGQAYSMAETIANNIRSKIKSALDINSPSRVMRDDVGRWIPAGIAVGMERNAGVVDNPLQRIKERIAGYDFSADNLLRGGKRVLDYGVNAFSSNNLFALEMANGGYTVEVPVNISEREVARVVAPIVRGENKKVERLERYRRGER